MKRLDWLKIRAEWFAGGCFIGLLTYAPFLALLNVFIAYFDADKNQILIKWVIFCGIICVLVTLNKKSPTELKGE